MTTLVIALPTELDRAIQDIAEWRDLSWGAVITRSIHAAHYVMTQRKEKRVIYQADFPLDFPRPQESEFAPMNSIRFDTTPRIEGFLKNLCKELGLAEHSSIEWGMKCMNILDDAMVLSTVSAKKDGEQIAIPYNINH